MNPFRILIVILLLNTLGERSPRKETDLLKLQSTAQHRQKSDCWAPQEALALPFSNCWVLVPVSLQPVHILCAHNSLDLTEKSKRD